MINDFLRFCYEQGWSEGIYNSIVIVSFLSQTVFLVIYRKNYEISLLKSLITVLLTYPSAFCLMRVLAWVESGFTNWGAQNIVRIYVYVPLIAILVAKIMKIPARKMIDYLAPSLPFQKFVGHLVCPFVGCCEGYPFSWGIWHPVKKITLFPNQWFECIVALLISWYLLRIAKQEKYSGSGKIYALFLLIGGISRFLLEFLRDNDKLFLGISNLAFHALFMTFVGTVWLLVLYEKDKQKEFKQKNHKRH